MKDGWFKASLTRGFWVSRNWSDTGIHELQYQHKKLSFYWLNITFSSHSSDSPKQAGITFTKVSDVSVKNLFWNIFLPYLPRKNYASEQVVTVSNLVMWLFILFENQ